MSQLLSQSHELRFFALLNGTELKTETHHEETDAPPPEINIPNPPEDWKLNPNVQSKIVLHKLKIKTPESGTIEFCRNFVECLRRTRKRGLRNPSVSVSSESEPTFSTSDIDIEFKSQFVLHVLLNEILGQCEEKEKCDVCDDYVEKLSHHISRTHGGQGQPKTTTSPSRDSDPVSVSVFKCGMCVSMCSSPSMLIRHWNTHSEDSDSIPWELDRMREGSVGVGVGGGGGHPPSPNRGSSFHIPESKPESIDSESDICSWSLRSVQPQHLLPFNPTLTLTLTPDLDHHPEWNCVKEEGSEEVELELEMENPYPGIEIPDVEEEEEEDPLLLSLKSIAPQTQTLEFHSTHHNDSLTIRERREKPHGCEVCGQRFKRKSTLTVHKRIHGGVNPNSCEMCGKSFLAPCNLRRHLMTHTGERPFQCDVCGKRFFQSTHLNTHKRTHTGEKPNECDVCGKSFLAASNLKRHKMIHTGEPRRECEVCGKRFKGESEYTLHKLTLHNPTSTITTHMDHSLTIQNNLKQEHESCTAEDVECQQDPLLNHLDMSS